MKTTDDLAAELASKIATIHRHPHMFTGSTEEAGAANTLDGMLWLAYSMWASAKARDADFRQILDYARERHQCSCQGFSNAFKRLNPAADEVAACQFVLQCWKEIAKELGIDTVI